MATFLTPSQRSLLEKLIQRTRTEPGFFARQVLGTNPWAKQIVIKEALLHHRRVTVRSGHGVGKTRVAAEAVLEWLVSHPDDAVVITTAPTWRQVESILWKEIRSLHARAKLPLGGNLTNTSLTVNDKCFAMGLSTDHPDRFQGYHSPNILVVVDEAAGVPQMIFEAIEGLMTSANARLLLIGNPTSTSGAFYDSFRSPLYTKISISCLECPNVIESREVIPGLTTREWVDDRRKEWGESSPLFQSRVLGDFPTESEDQLFPLSVIQAALQRDHVFNSSAEWSLAKSCIGIDVARFGDDHTVLTAYRDPKVIQVRSFQGKPLTDIVGRARQMSQETRINSFAVDDTGVGGGVTDMLLEAGFNVFPVNFGAKPTIEDSRFTNLKTQMFWHLKEKFRLGHICLNNIPEWEEQLPSIRYEMASDSSIRIVGKREMKKQGFDSPDFADSLAIGVWGAQYDEETDWAGAGEELGVEEDLFTTLGASLHG